ncbi:LysR family transcriptional regulator [Pseudomonas syringae]|nr:LysR family transcriptional regulator [Pseudomonas syringae]MBD8790523.1 LysR family transcriptional regulator [Pseudomonas syringae]MBD8798761.1 LysR family transcriptional regulator [Pseudomonas syringae]MBD8809587.1 LysR family transcriptional regulator [Pseudomonas syringae]
MRKAPYVDLLALIAVAHERSFTRAAARLQVSQSMLSHTIGKLEEHLGVRLLTRTTRSVSVTEAGQRLLDGVQPRLQAIEAQLRLIAQSGQIVAGTLRIGATEHAIDTLLWPRLSPLLAAHPQLSIELYADNRTVENEARYDFTVRLGDEPPKDNTAVRIGPNLPMALVCAPACRVGRSLPDTAHELAGQPCIALRAGPGGPRPGWVLNQAGQSLRIEIEARLSFDSFNQVLRAALAGHGLAYVPLDLAQAHLDSGALLAVMRHGWHAPGGYHLYSTQRGEASPLTHLLIQTLQYNG